MSAHTCTNTCQRERDKNKFVSDGYATLSHQLLFVGLLQALAEANFLPFCQGSWSNPGLPCRCSSCLLDTRRHEAWTLLRIFPQELLKKIPQKLKAGEPEPWDAWVCLSWYPFQGWFKEKPKRTSVLTAVPILLTTVVVPYSDAGSPFWD